ncbi:hypothetical protein ACFOSV_06855 [Algoriphagus namhaensis]|uniref:Uncharacterized protein n=1 Tax=Algoriphagus namhaensis TaxID=915353 RepID=A0ABV8APG7_9BACT
MKTHTLTLILALFRISFSFASDYEEAMKTQLSEMKNIQSDAEAQQVKNGFLRIAQANMTEWLPMYYAALVQTEAALRFEVDKDAYFEEAKEYLKIIKDAGAANSEITALEGYILMGIVAVDPGSRGQSLSPQVLQLFGKAIGQDRNNPRAVYLMAQMEGGMAKFFGQGPEKACGMVKMSLDLFEKEAEKIDENYLLPSWGWDNAKKMYAECN